MVNLTDLVGHDERNDSKPELIRYNELGEGGDIFTELKYDHKLYLINLTKKELKVMHPESKVENGCTDHKCIEERINTLDYFLNGKEEKQKAEGANISPDQIFYVGSDYFILEDHLGANEKEIRFKIYDKDKIKILKTLVDEKIVLLGEKIPDSVNKQNLETGYLTDRFYVDSFRLNDNIAPFMNVVVPHSEKVHGEKFKLENWDTMVTFPHFGEAFSTYYKKDCQKRSRTIREIRIKMPPDLSATPEAKSLDNVVLEGDKIDENMNCIMIDDDIGRGVTVAEIIKLLKKKKIKPIGFYAFLDIMRITNNEFGSDYVREFGYPVVTYVTIEDVFNFAYVDAKIYRNSIVQLDYLKEKEIDVKEFAKKQKDWFWSKYLNPKDGTNCRSEDKKYPKPYVKV